MFATAAAEPALGMAPSVVVRVSGTVLEKCPRSAKRYSARTFQRAAMAASTPSPAVQPIRMSFQLPAPNVVCTIEPAPISL